MNVIFILSIVLNVIFVSLFFIQRELIRRLEKIWNETHKSLLEQDAEIVEIDGKKFKNANLLVEIKQ